MNATSTPLLILNWCLRSRTITPHKQRLTPVAASAGNGETWYCYGPLETEAAPTDVCTNGQNWFLVADSNSKSLALVAPVLKEEPARPIAKASPSHILTAGHACALAAIQGAVKHDFTDFKEDATKNAESISPVGALVVRRHLPQMGAPRLHTPNLMIDGAGFDGSQWVQMSAKPRIMGQQRDFNFFCCDCIDEPSPPAAPHAEAVDAPSISSPMPFVTVCCYTPRTRRPASARQEDEII